MSTLASVSMASITGTPPMEIRLEVDEKDGLLVSFWTRSRMHAEQPSLLKFVRADEFFSGMIKLTEAALAETPLQGKEGA